MGTTTEKKKFWFAARITGHKQSVKHLTERDDIQTYSAPIVQNILFIHCTKQYLRFLTEQCPGALFFYRNPNRTEPQAIDEKQMLNFMLVTSAPEDCLINLDNVDRNFIKGQRVRVTAGVFQGAEGVVKRIKGDRRLIVSITGVACVATCYIHPSLLEPVTERDKKTDKM